MSNWPRRSGGRRLVPDDEDDEGTKRAELVKRFATLRSFWTAIIDVMPFEAAEGGKSPVFHTWPPRISFSNRRHTRQQLRLFALKYGAGCR